MSSLAHKLLCTEGISVKSEGRDFRYWNRQSALLMVQSDGSTNLFSLPKTNIFLLILFFYVPIKFLSSSWLNFNIWLLYHAFITNSSDEFTNFFPEFSQRIFLSLSVEKEITDFRQKNTYIRNSKFVKLSTYLST